MAYSQQLESALEGEMQLLEQRTASLRIGSEEAGWVYIGGPFSVQLPDFLQEALKAGISEPGRLAGFVANSIGEGYGRQALQIASQPIPGTSCRILSADVAAGTVEVLDPSSLSHMASWPATEFAQSWPFPWAEIDPPLARWDERSTDLESPETPSRPSRPRLHVVD